MKPINHVIDRETELKIWKKYYSSREIKLRSFLFCLYLRHVNKIASYTSMKIPAYSLMSFEDIISACISGHLETIDSFNPYMGTMYTTFSSKRIYGEIIDETRKLQDLPIYINKLRRELMPIIQKLTHILGKIPNDDDIYDLVEKGIISLDHAHPLVRTNTFNETNLEQYKEFKMLESIAYNRDNKEKKKINYSKIIEVIPDDRCQFIILSHFFWNLPLSDAAKVLEISNPSAHGLKVKGLQILKNNFSSYQSMVDFIYEQC